MWYDKLNGLFGMDGGADAGSAAAPSQQGLGSPASGAPSSGSGSASPSTGPSSLTFISDNGGPPPDNSAVTTTQIVTFANSGLVFDNSYTGNVSAAYQSCVLSAEQALANICTNSVTINVEFDAQAEGQNGELASNEFWTVNESYASLKSALTSLSSAEPNNTVLQQAVAHLPSTDPSGGKGFELPLAYAQILGLSTATRNPEDIVTLNTSYNWSYGQDVINTLEHEISEGGMGRIGGLGDQNSLWSTMDLFRYNSSGQPDYTDGRDGRTTYFSYNGGATLSTLSFNNEYSGNTKVNGGDTADFTQLDVFGTGDPGETNTLSATDLQMMEALGWAPPTSGNPLPPAATTASMIMVDGSGNYEIYDVGNNSLLANYPLTQIGSPWQAVGFGNFSGTDTTDMLLRNMSSGALQVDDVSGNNVTQTAVLGGVGLEWSVVGFGKFDSSGYSDMIMRRTDGTYDLFFIRNNQITAANTIAAVGSEWQTAGFGDFNGDGTTDMLLRNSNTGAFEYYDIVNGQITSAGVLGQVSTQWQVVGFGNFDNSGYSDMIMHNSTNGAYDLYVIRNNQITSSQQIAAVGAEWQFAGFADLNGDGTTDMLLRNSSGAFEYYDIANGQVTAAGSLGQIGTQWTVSGLAPDKITATSTMTSNATEGTTTDGDFQAFAGIPTGAETFAAGPADAQPASLDASGGSLLSDAGAENQQGLSMDDFLPVTPSLGSFLQPAAGGEAWSTEGWYGNADPWYSGAGATQQPGGQAGVSLGLAPTMSSLSAAPAGAESFAALPEIGNGTPLLTNPLQHPAA
jgi:hypothetical protein